MGEDYRGMHTPTLANGGPANQPQSRIAKGDQLHCTVSIIPDTTYCRATHVRTVRTKKDCFLFEQVTNSMSNLSIMLIQSTIPFTIRNG